MPVPCKSVMIAPGIHWVGAEDWQRRSFDVLVPLPYGTSYNSYLVTGREKTALVDTVLARFSDEMMARISCVGDVSKVDYVVMNHAEPDHAGAIGEVLAASPGAKLVASEKGVAMAIQFSRIPADRCITVRDGDTIKLGGKTLKFVSAPWLHWPETMFTFAVEDRVLFSCDFFGAHFASDRIADDEVGDALLPEAKVYYALIMMPYAKMAAAGLDKAIGLKPQVIAPSHGPIYRNPQRIITAYERWIRGPLQKKAVVAFVTIYGSTQKLGQAIAASLSAEGVETIPYDLSVADPARIAADLVDASAVVLGSPTVLGAMHPVAAHAALIVRELRPRARVGAFFGSFGWGGGAAAQARTALEQAKMEIVDVLDVKGPPFEAEMEKAVILGKKIADKVSENLAATIVQG